MTVKGYCRFCDVKNFENVTEQDTVDARIRDMGVGKFNEWARARGMKGTSPHTFYAHRQHILNPQDRIVSAVEKRQREGGVQPARTTHDEFLQSLVSIGAAKVAADPDSVTVDQALKAAKIQADREKKGQGNQVLIQLFTGGAPSEGPTIIEGEVSE